MVLVVMNPGTGPVDGARRKHAKRNVFALVRDVGLEGVRVFRAGKPDDGRYPYRLRLGERDCKVDMPGLPLECVRYQSGMNPWQFPRLYVEGNSWLWVYAVNQARHELTGEDE
jgi:hypothetical protein